MKHPSRTPIILPCFLMMFLALAISFPAIAADTGTKRVLILPLSIHSEKKAPFLSKGILDMMTSRISQSATAIPQTDPKPGKTPLQLGQEMNADYVVSGSVTLFDNAVSTDATLIQTKTGETVLRLSQVGQSGGDVLFHVNQFATQINQYLANSSASAVSVTPSAAPAVSPVPPVSATPTLSPAVEAASSDRTQKPDKLWTSSAFKGVISALTTADVTGDGKPDIIFLHEKQLVVMTKNGTRLDRVATVDVGANHTLISVDAGDINGNRAAEIFVTRLNSSNKLESLVLEWNGSALSPIATDQTWYFRVIRDPEKGSILLGQRRGIPAKLDTGGLYTDTMFVPGIFELTAHGNGYTAGSRLAASNDQNIYQVARGPIFNDNRPHVIAYSAGDQLRVYDSGGVFQWSGQETLGGSPFFLPTPSLAYSRTEDRIYLSQRLIPVDLDGDGVIEVVTVHNQDLTRGVVGRFRRYTQGRVVVLRWNAVNMKTVWSGESVSGYISDFSVSDLDGDGKPEAVYAMVTSGGWLKANTSQIVVEPFGRLETH